ncbi:hypothetical protein [Lysobacter sp. F6437]|uniref:hypothetical protein n=1 Tax=Lysobacter sp. F6437 TaxID=3459296 RepID=UPI00403E33D3
MGKLVVSLVLALSCAGVASAAEPVPANTTTEAAATGATAADAADYKPRTEHDNTPWRFNMEQGGKRMSADQFDAWMKSKGVRVAKGPAATPAASTAATGSAATDVVAAPDAQAAE